jgi:hypothetical protein
MEVDGEAIEERLGRLLEALEIVPPAMAGELAFEIAPQPLNEVELRRIGGQKEGLDALRVRPLPLAQRMTLVVADVVEDDDEGLHGEGGDQLIEEGDKRVFAFARAQGMEEASTGIVEGAEDDELLILPSGGNPHRLPLAPPDLCQVRMGMDLALVHVDQMGSASSGSS